MRALDLLERGLVLAAQGLFEILDVKDDEPEADKKKSAPADRVAEKIEEYYEVTLHVILFVVVNIWNWQYWFM